MIDNLYVVCFLWGGWGDERGIEYVEKLYSGVRRHLPKDFKFICFTDLDPITFAGTDICAEPLACPDWMWNLRKMYMYHYAMEQLPKGARVLAFDLDVVITGDLSELAEFSVPFITCRGAFRPGNIGGSLIGFEAGFGEQMLYRPLLKNAETIERATSGSERGYYQRQFRKFKYMPMFWQDKYPGQVRSFKVDCMMGLPEDARVVRFHGMPTVDAMSWVGEQWIR